MNGIDNLKNRQSRAFVKKEKERKNATRILIISNIGGCHHPVIHRLERADERAKQGKNERKIVSANKRTNEPTIRQTHYRANAFSADRGQKRKPEREKIA